VDLHAGLWRNIFRISQHARLFSLAAELLVMYESHRSLSIAASSFRAAEEYVNIDVPGIAAL